MGKPECFHNGIILIVICLKFIANIWKIIDIQYIFYVIFVYLRYE